MNINSQKILLIIIFMVSQMNAQGRRPPPPPPGLPINETIIFLLLVGVVYGIYILRK